MHCDVLNIHFFIKKGADKKGHDERAIAEDAIRTLDANRDNKITKGEDY
jgi:hypothetical protein